MAAKPSDVGRFAVTAGGVDASNIVLPSAGLRDNGWSTNAIPTSGNLNYLENLGARWRAYLSDGNLTGGVTIDTLGVTGVATLSTLSVTTVSTFNGDIVAVGDIKHGDRSLSLAPHSALVVLGSAAIGLSSISFGAASSQIIVSVPLKAGDRLKSYTLGFFGDGAVDVTCEFVRCSATSALTTINTTTITNAPSSYVVTTINPADTTLLAGEFFIIRYTASGGGGTHFYGATCVTFDRP